MCQGMRIVDGMRYCFSRHAKDAVDPSGATGHMSHFFISAARLIEARTRVYFTMPHFLPLF